MKGWLSHIFSSFENKQNSTKTSPAIVWVHPLGLNISIRANVCIEAAKSNG
jgi:hypothetical protein